MERLAGRPAVCTLYDYGLDGAPPPLWWRPDSLDSWDRKYGAAGPLLSLNSAFINLIFGRDSPKIYFVAHPKSRKRV